MNQIYVYIINLIKSEQQIYDDGFVNSRRFNVQFF
jgi:hypothetical protein